MLPKEPEMLQPDAFCEHTMQQNVTAVGALSAPDLAGGAYSAPSDPLTGFKGQGKGRERRKRLPGAKVSVTY